MSGELFGQFGIGRPFNNGEPALALFFKVPLELIDHGDHVIAGHAVRGICTQHDQDIEYILAIRSLARTALHVEHGARRQILPRHLRADFIDLGDIEHDQIIAERPQGANPQGPLRVAWA